MTLAETLCEIKSEQLNMRSMFSHNFPVEKLLLIFILVSLPLLTVFLKTNPPTVEIRIVQPRKGYLDFEQSFKKRKKCF